MAECAAHPCDAVDNEPGHEVQFCEGCGCCADCCNCAETDCDCDVCADQRSYEREDHDDG